MILQPGARAWRRKNKSPDTLASQAQTSDSIPTRLRAKYREERDKRLRPDGNDQYLEVAGAFSRFVDDPYVEPGFTREPLCDDVEVLVIGGGFGGLLAAARLREAGIEDIRIIEKGGDFGGTWYWNRYPGAMCDVESYIYLPLLEELGYVPTEKYARAPEILAHSQAIGRKYDLYRGACFQTEVTEMRWDSDSARWIVSTDRDDRMRARFVCMSNGPLNRPKLPGIPGIETFRGHSFHTSRWDYAYTGGDSNGNLTGLRGKRVGIIGTGATAVQCVPHLGESAEQLYVFQRTPSSIDVRANRPTDPEWAQSLSPGWHQHRMDNFNILVSGGFQAEDLVADGWTDIIRKLLVMVQADPGGDAMRDLAKTMELADFQKMEQIRARVDQVVKDRATAEALKPYYRQFCKRPCFHDEYLDTFNRPNVRLVDTKGRGVERVTENGVVVDGVEYAVDCLIYATGFEVGTEYTRRAGYEMYGRDGVEPHGALGGRHPDPPRHAQPRLSQLLHHGRPAERLHRELPAHAERAEPAHRLHREARPRPRRPLGRGVGRGRGRMGGNHHPTLAAGAAVPRRVHAGLLQQRGQAGRAERPERLLRRRLGGLLQAPA